MLTFEVKRTISPRPADVDQYVAPDRKKLAQTMAVYLRPSPYIESTHREIKAAAEEIAAADPKNAWEHAKAIHDWVCSKVKHQARPKDGAAQRHAQCPARRDRRLQRVNVPVRGDLPGVGHPGANRLRARPLLSGVLPVRHERPGALVARPVAGVRRRARKTADDTRRDNIMAVGPEPRSKRRITGLSRRILRAYRRSRESTRRYS